MYLGGNISENGRVEVEVRRRIQAGANGWRNVEGVMMDRKISRKLKGKVLDSCVVPATVVPAAAGPLGERPPALAGHFCNVPTTLPY